MSKNDLQPVTSEGPWETCPVAIRKVTDTGACSVTRVLRGGSDMALEHSGFYFATAGRGMALVTHAGDFYRGSTAFAPVAVFFLGMARAAFSKVEWMQGQNRAKRTSIYG